MSGFAIERKLDLIVQRMLETTVPPILYHYTNWGGAEGIISSQEFWATAHDCTNDETELVSADATIIKVVKGLRSSATKPTLEILETFLKNYANSQVTQVMPVYLACFSASRDDRDQWKKYADNGRGLCLGVRVIQEPPPEKWEIRSGLVKVDYSESSWRDRLKETMGEVCAILNRRSASLLNQKAGLSALYRIAAFASIMAKKPIWKIEQEFRHVTIPHPDADINPNERHVLGKTIRYLSVKVRATGKRIAFGEILIGANQEFESASERLKKILELAGYAVGDAEYPKIIPSGAMTGSATNDPILMTAL